MSYAGFGHCVWWTPPDDHPWFAYTAAPHLSIRTHLSRAEALAFRDYVRATAVRPVVRLHGSLQPSEDRGFHALTLRATADDAPAWWPYGAHVSFRYRYHAPFSAAERASVTASIAVRRAPTGSVRVVRCEGPFTTWHVVSE